MGQQALGASEDLDELEDTLTESSPMAAPRYADARWQELGERLATLYTTRDEASGDAKTRIEGEIAAVRGQMRKGPRLHAGEFLADGRYRLLNRMSLDAESARWLAYDRVHRRLVTLAVLHAPWVEEESQIESMVARAERLSAVDHPQVAHVLEGARSEEGFAYVASRYCGLVDLHGVVLQGALTPVDAVQVALELADGLRAVHAQNLTHGALAPQAVLIAEDGGAHLTGFRVGPAGQAQSLYAAPEAISPAHAGDPRGDVYALGMTLLFALHGEELPFWVLRDAGRLVDTLEVSPTVQEVLRIATAWDPESRFPHTQAFADALLADDALVAALADRAYERERFAVSAAHYERLLLLRPADAVQLQTRLGDVYIRLDAQDDAFRHLTMALEQAVASGSTLSAEQAIAPQIALLEHQADLTGDSQRLVGAFEELAAKLIGPRRAVLRSHLARTQQERMGDLAAAEQSWTQVLAEHHTPELARVALSSLAQLAEAQGVWLDYIRHSTELLPYLSPQERPRVQFDIGRVCIQHTGDEDVGLSWIDRAEAGGLRTLELCEELERLRARRGQWPRVIELMMRRAQVLDAEQVSRLLLRAGFMARSVHLDGLALEVYQELLRRVPRHIVALRELARLHYRGREPKAALQYFEALHDPKAARGVPRIDEAESGERATDLLAHARLLLRAGRAEEASNRLNEALELAGDLVPALRLVAPIELARGRIDEAGQVWERLLALHVSLDQEPHRIAACVGLGDVAWIQGKLAMARGYYNRAIEADPECTRAWWGIARTGLAAKGGHPGLDRAPWLGATPIRVTPPESLARLLISILDVDAMRGWLARSPVGKALIAGGDSSIRVALGVVDVMLYHGLIDRELFTRLIEVRPTWKARIDAVADQFFGVSSEVDDFGTYLGPAGAVQGDFDRGEPRKLLSWVGMEAIASLSEVSLDDEAFAALTAGDVPVAPDPKEPETAPIAMEPRDPLSQVGALLRDGRTWAVLDTESPQLVLGSSSRADVRIEHAQASAEQLVLYRVGEAIYLRAEPGVRVDGEPAQRRRLMGGEAVEVCEILLDFVLESDADALPERFEGSGEDSEPTALFRAASPEELSRAEEAATAEVRTLDGLSADLPSGSTPEEARTERIKFVPSDLDGLEAPDSPPHDPEDDALPIPEGHGPAEPELAEVGAPPENEPPPEGEATPEDEAIPEEDATPKAQDGSDERPPGGAEPAASPGTEGEDIEASAPGDQVPAHEEPAPPAPPDAADPSGPTQSETEHGEAPSNLFLTPPDPTGGVPQDPHMVRAETPEPMRERTRTRRKQRTPPPPPLRPREPTPNPAARHAELIRRRMRRMATYQPPSASAPPAEPREAVPGITQISPPPALDPSDEASAITEIAAPPPVERAPAETFPKDPASTGEFTVIGEPGSLDSPASPVEAAPVRALVEVMSGPARGQFAEVEQVLRIGSAPENELAIAGDGRLEPHHCTVARTPEGFILQDAGSGGGTVMNGARVDVEAALTGGEVIMVGRTVLRFKQVKE